MKILEFKRKFVYGVMVFVAFFMIMFMKNEIEIYASDSDAEIVTIKKEIDLGDGCSITLYADAYVEYAWDEGVYGWIENDVTLADDGGIASDSVYIDDFTLVNFSDPGSSVYTITYYFYGFEHKYWYNTFSGYIKINISCDEWGNIDWWVSYEEC